MNMITVRCLTSPDEELLIKGNLTVTGSINGGGGGGGGGAVNPTENILPVNRGGVFVDSHLRDDGAGVITIGDLDDANQLDTTKIRVDSINHLLKLIVEQSTDHEQTLTLSGGQANSVLRSNGPNNTYADITVDGANSGVTINTTYGGQITLAQRTVIYNGLQLNPSAFDYRNLTPGVGSFAVFTDSPVNTWGAAITIGGGTFTVLAFFNGTDWTVAAI
jgi:hypothetical protein